MMNSLHVLVILYVITLHRTSCAETLRQEQMLRTNSNSTFKTVCYYPMDSPLNTTSKNPLPQGLNASLCSHVILIPTKINDNRIVVADPSHAIVFQRAIPVLRQINPKLIIMVSNIGPFDSVMKSLQSTAEFVNSTVAFLRKYGFDGIDLDWEFPAWPITQKPPEQRHNFSIVVTQLRQSFEIESRQTKKPRLLLSAAVAATLKMAGYIYEFDYLKKALDFVNMMGYDYNGWGASDPLSWFTAYNSPLFPESYDKRFFNKNNLAWSATYWGSKIGKDKVMVGIPFYSHAYKLLAPYNHGYHAVAIGLGECEQAGYTCACLAIKNKNASSVFDNSAMVPYCYYGNQWVSYDNVKSISIKTKWILDNGFAGLMTWSMITDDVDGVCDGKTRYPLMMSVLQTIAEHRGKF